MKRLVDVLLSVTTLTLLSPVFLVVAILIKLDSPGPVFHRGRRVGRWGRTFLMYKFRSMVADAEKIGGPDTPADDPRITKVGQYVRKFNLDELAQMINVLKGDMSIVGPRPEVPERVALFAKEYETLLQVRPGITDWATVHIRDEGKILAGSEDPAKTYLEKIWPQKHRLALEYVENKSLTVDLEIMVKTLKVHLLDRLWPRA